MAYQITPEQYANLQRARENWPEKLSYFSREGDKRCVLSYLSNLAGLRESEVIQVIAPHREENTIQSGKERLSEIYGLPVPVLNLLFEKNSKRKVFIDGIEAVPGTKRRSQRVRREFDYALSQVEIKETPEQKATRTLDGFLQNINSSNQSAELETA